MVAPQWAQRKRGLSPSWPLSAPLVTMDGVLGRASNVRTNAKQALRLPLARSP